MYTDQNKKLNLVKRQHSTCVPIRIQNFTSGPYVAETYLIRR